MRFGILSEEHKIMVVEGIEDISEIQMREIKRNFPERQKLENMVFFYMPDKDWIVINRGHTLYDFYLQLISAYLELPEQQRKACMVEAPTATIKNAFYILDEVIYNRALIYGKAV